MVACPAAGNPRNCPNNRTQQASSPQNMDTSRRKMKRTLKPSTKRRRPPLACIQCYQRKVKCGKEFPSCSRCVRAGIAEECTYRGVLTHQKDGMTSPARSNYQEAAPVPRVLSSESGLQAESQPAPAGIHEMTHLRRRGGLIQFYGYSYHMNFYQQVSIYYLLS